jgi:hypothetical protein
MMEYFQNDMLSYYSSKKSHRVQKILFQYSAPKEEARAALNFHLTKRERLGIMSSVNFPVNTRSFQQLQQALENK